MNKIKKITILVLVIIVYLTITLVTGNEVQAGERTEDLSNLVNYPEIYTAIQEMKTAHPNWTFTVLYTGLNWNDVIENEIKHIDNGYGKITCRSLVQNSSIIGNVYDWVCPEFGTSSQDSGSWYCASSKTVEYYIDPRNWLNETYIFAFETLSFNSNFHTIDGVQAMLAGTFMDTGNVITYKDINGNVQTINKSYAQVIYEAGVQNNISPYHLAARILQEQGNGTSSLISGEPYTYDGVTFSGYYNYFNIGATGSTMHEVIGYGLISASAKNWTTPEIAIKGGAEFLKGGYIGNYQDTIYLQKYNVDSNSPSKEYSHQYQQNVSAPYTEGYSVYDAYEELGILESNFNFIIPVFENMPSSASVKPGRNVTLTTESVEVQTRTTDLIIRTSPSINGYTKATVPKGTILTRIERANEVSSDGHYWDRVAYNTGNEIIIGYSSREYLGDVTTTESISEEATVTIMCALKNGPASTVNTKVKQLLIPGTKVTVIDKILYPYFGHVWYRVKLTDGTQGFVSAAYLQTEPVIVLKYKIDGSNIIITPDTVISDIPEAILNGEVLGTGAKITLGDSEYNIVMLGDTTGDGNITPLDYVKVKNNIMGISSLENLYKIAGDTTGDGDITPLDYVKIKNHIMNMSKISL